MGHSLKLRNHILHKKEELRQKHQIVIEKISIKTAQYVQHDEIWRLTKLILLCKKLPYYSLIKRTEW